MFKYRFAVLHCTKKQFGKTLVLAYRVSLAVTGNANFGTPVPTPVALLAAADLLQAAIIKWGTANNRGSHADYEDLLQKQAACFALLKSMCSYVNTTAQLAAAGDNALLTAILMTSGFDLNKVPVSVDVLAMVSNLRQVMKKNLAPNKGCFAWDLPEESKKGDVDFYIVRKGTTSVFADSEVISTQTKNEFTDTNDSTAPVTNWYWVSPGNKSTEGVPSQPIRLTLGNL